MRAKRTAVRIFGSISAAAALCALSITLCVSPAGGNEKFNWDQTLSRPAYVYHSTWVSTYSINQADDKYLWHTGTPDKKGVLHDSMGHYKVTKVAGPLHTPRAICKTWEGLDHSKMNGAYPPGGWAGVSFNCKALAGGKPPSESSSEESITSAAGSAAANAVKGAGAGAAVVALVNGIPVLSMLLGGDGSKNRRRRKRKYTLDIKVQDGQGVKRTNISADDEDFIWIYARVKCDDPKVNTSLMTRTLAFLKEGPASEWLVISHPRMTYGCKVVAVKAKPPFPDAELTINEAIVAVIASMEGQQVRGPVDITLELYEVVFGEMLDEPRSDPASVIA